MNKYIFGLVIFMGQKFEIGPDSFFSIDQLHFLPSLSLAKYLVQNVIELEFELSSI